MIINNDERENSFMTANVRSCVCVSKNATNRTFITRFAIRRMPMVELEMNSCGAKLGFCVPNAKYWMEKPKLMTITTMTKKMTQLSLSERKLFLVSFNFLGRRGETPHSDDIAWQSVGRECVLLSICDMKCVQVELGPCDGYVAQYAKTTILRDS